MHSEYFSSIFRDNNEDEKITLPQVKPVVFADFQSGCTVVNIWSFEITAPLLEDTFMERN
jgi:hypothetical protein